MSVLRRVRASATERHTSLMAPSGQETSSARISLRVCAFTRLRDGAQALHLVISAPRIPL